MNNLLLFLLTFSAISCYGQVVSSSNTDAPANNESKSQVFIAKVLKITDDAGRYFKNGLRLLNDNQRQLARKEFDNSIEAFLISDISIKDDATLKECYGQLIETIYRLEFPNNQVPQIRSLSGTCGWTIDTRLADSIAKRSQSTPLNQTNNDAALASVVGSQTQRNDSQNGFTEQSFEASPLDKLAKLELVSEESNKKTVYSRPNTPNVLKSNISVVKANQGDTVEILAKRHGANPVEVAKFNGLLINTKLSVGREIAIPVDEKKLFLTLTDAEKTAGLKPKQLQDGSIPSVLKYFDEYMNDPYSLKVVRWGKIKLTSRNRVFVWTACVKFRAKNGFGAYRLASMAFYFNKGEVIATDDINDCIE